MYAASCCGGGANFPALITGDYKSQLSAAFSTSAVIGHTDENNQSYFHADDNNEDSQTIRLIGSTMISERTQLGASLPFSRRVIDRSGVNRKDSGLGDIEFHGAYEILPEYGYSVWKPRGFLFSSLTLPTGPSIHDEEVVTSIERARGKGFTTLKTGLSFFKVWGNWDGQILAQVEKSFDRTFRYSGQEVTKKSDLSWGALLAFGHSPFASDFRWGLSIAPYYRGAIKNQSDVELAESQLVWDANISLSYMFSFDWSVNLIYSDQTIIGPSKNATLSRSSTLSFQKKWSL